MRGRARRLWEGSVCENSPRRLPPLAICRKASAYVALEMKLMQRPSLTEIVTRPERKPGRGSQQTQVRGNGMCYEGKITPTGALGRLPGPTMR